MEIESGERVTRAALVEAPVPSGEDLILTGFPRAVITLEALQKIKCYVDLMPLEINGFGIVEVEGSTLYITNPFILDQRVSGGHAETDSMAYNCLVSRMIREGKDPSHIRLQWHSHVSMPAYFSHTDLGTIADYEGYYDWMVSLVLNKQGDYRCRLDVYRPLRIALALPLFVRMNVADETLTEQCRDDINQHVREGWRVAGLHIPSPKSILGKNTHRMPEGDPVILPVEQILGERTEEKT
ncbi:MAG: hypothetical protein Q7S09_02785 [bacterium]|nr:hypothetical protein [bacterium]